MHMGNDGFIIDAGKRKGVPLEGIRLNAVMRNVYGWMTMGLLVTAAIALGVYNSGMIPSQLVMMLAIFAQLGIVFGLSFAIRRISATAAGMLFFAYSALTGFTLSIIFVAFTTGVDCGGVSQHGGRLCGDDGGWADDQCRFEQVQQLLHDGLDWADHRQRGEYLPGQHHD